MDAAAASQWELAWSGWVVVLKEKTGVREVILETRWPAIVRVLVEFCVRIVARVVLEALYAVSFERE